MSGAPLVLLGAGGLAREVMAMLPTLGRTVVAVLDDDPRLHGQQFGSATVSGGMDAVVDFPDAELLACVGSGPGRRAVATRMAAQGVGDDRWATVVHPSVGEQSALRLGPGCILLQGVVATADVRVGSHVVMMPNVVLTHDCLVESFATLCAGVCLGGAVRIGANAYLGMNASVRQGVQVGANSVLGMGGVLLSDLPAGQTWVGVPATRLRETTSTTAERAAS